MKFTSVSNKFLEINKCDVWKQRRQFISLDIKYCGCLYLEEKPLVRNKVNSIQCFGQVASFLKKLGVFPKSRGPSKKKKKQIISYGSWSSGWRLNRQNYLCFIRSRRIYIKEQTIPGNYFLSPKIRDPWAKSKVRNGLSLTGPVHHQVDADWQVHVA